MNISPTTIQIKITKQEQDIINHCSGKTFVPWEELAQYAKEPQTVKLKTLQKAVSDLKKKYRDANLPVPFDCSFKSLVDVEQKKKQTPAPPPPSGEQKLVQIRMTKGGN